MENIAKIEEEINVNEIFLETVKDIKDLCKNAEVLFEKSNSLYVKIEEEMSDMKKENIALLRLVHKEFDSQDAILHELKKMTASTDDTLLNVLLAIRQNEYLQAYYPAQNGFPEMKVVGMHPAKFP